MILKVADRTLDDREDQVHSHAAQTISFDRVEVARVVGSGFCRTLQPEMKSQLCIVAEGRPPSATLFCLLVENTPFAMHQMAGVTSAAAAAVLTLFFFIDF